MYIDVAMIFYIIFRNGIEVLEHGLQSGLPSALEPTAWHPQQV